MAASRSEIQAWFFKGVARKATHMLVVYDTYGYADFPIYVGCEGFDAWTGTVQEALAHCDGQKMLRVMEVYDLAEDAAKQLDPSVRTWAVR